MSLVAGLIGGLGLACIMIRRTLLGMMIGVQLLVIGSTLMFVLAGISAGGRLQGHLAGLLIALGGLAQLAGGYAVAVRMFYLRSDIDLDQLRALKK